MLNFVSSSGLGDKEFVGLCKAIEEAISWAADSLHKLKLKLFRITFSLKVCNPVPESVDISHKFSVSFGKCVERILEIKEKRKTERERDDGKAR